MIMNSTQIYFAWYKTEYSFIQYLEDYLIHDIVVTENNTHLIAFNIFVLFPSFVQL